MPEAPCPAETEARRSWMGVLARAEAGALAALVEGVSLPGYRVIRGPEAGLVMLRGRAGGDGAAFNLGEMTVVRCTVRSEAGFLGHAYVKGRDAAHAERAAVLDAALQDEVWHGRVMAAVVAPLAAEESERRARKARRAAATRVEFLAMATMR